MPYIKSHSNYILKKKHQDVSNGTVYERDMTTIGGRDNFAPGQVPLYRSGNFVITVNNDNDVTKSVQRSSWEKNTSGDVWTLKTLDNYIIEDNASDDKRIELKKNFYDLRDFAYFGSCSELVRASIDDIIKHFPGELYIPYEINVVSSITYNDSVYDELGNSTTSPVTNTFTNVEDIPSDILKNSSVTTITTYNGVPVFYYDSTKYNGGNEFDVGFDKDGNSLREIRRLGGDNMYLVDNPFGINIYTDHVNESIITDDNFLKYFANNGYKNYEAIDVSGVAHEFTIDTTILETDGEGYSFYVQPTSQDVGNSDGSFFANIFSYKDDGCIGKKYAYTTFTIKDNNDKFSIETFISNDNKAIYLINLDEKSDNFKLIDNNTHQFTYRIRPKKVFIEEFFSNLDNFEKVLLNRKSSPIYTATFNIINDDEYGYFTDIEKFTFPRTYGGYNIGSYDSAYSDYVSKLAEIAEYYDENFSDNMYRSMTHEAIKNFDWTYEKNKVREVEEDIQNSANKIASVIRLFGREYDELLSYINNITSYNVITYNNINNLPDYFLSDSVDGKGWDVKQVIPYTLYEYVGDDITNEYTVKGEARKEDEKNNSVNGEHLHRIFNQDTKLKFKPYTKDFDQPFPNGYFYICTCGNGSSIKPSDSDYVFSINPTEKTNLPNSTGTFPVDLYSYYNDKSDVPFYKTSTDLEGNEITGETYIDCSGTLRTRIKNYSSENEWTMTELNNEFLKRLYINSTYIWRHKGTQDGVEMILGMFGMKSKRWYDALPEYEKETYKDDTYRKFDFEIKEYTSFAKAIEDPYISDIGDFKYDWINKAKEISYGTSDYEPYQGLPVTYRLSEDENKRYIYPYFDKSKTYDGNIYYQMNGGWLDTYPYLFDKDNNLINHEEDKHIYNETLRDTRSVDTLQDLFNIPVQNISDGDIVYVNDISGKYAIVDGIIYDIIEETDGNETYKYITVTPQYGSVTVGNAYFDDYIVVSDPFTVDNKRRYVLTDNSYDGTDIKIYLIPSKTSSNDIIYAYSDENSVSTFTIFENGKYMEGDNFTHYFRINDVNSSQELSLMGWEQLRDTDNDYYRMNAEKDYFFGNNPHTGHYHYDNGHEYFTYFRHLFRYASDNVLFNNAALADYNVKDNQYETIFEDIYDYGFKGLIADNTCTTDYEQYLTEDTKIHYFGDFFYHNDNDSYDYYSTYTESNKTNSKIDGKNKFNSYNLTSVNPSSVEIGIETSQKGYGELFGFSDGDKIEANTDIDGVTDQIMNNKIVKIIFYIRNDNFYSKEALEEVKYLQSVVVPYMTQMLPSGIILMTEYIYNTEEVITYTAKTMDQNKKLIDGVRVQFGDNEYSGYTEQGIIKYVKR